FAQDKNPADLLRAARLALEGVAADFALRRVENQDWERVWMEDYRPMHFGRRLSVYPAHIPPADSSRINIILDPGLAFGTGTHPTTALCLRWLDACELEGKTCIDYGCGSGILAVAALKLGASRVYAADIDTQALTATRQNAERNRVISGLLIHTPDQIGAVQADVLLANILSNTIIQLAAVLTALLKPGGSLVLSGILATQAAAVRAAFIPAFDFGLEETVDGWVLLAGIKKSDQKR
ncbi:MAG TPA: 50S ribosomal protein L11 methyltransferase, partial [Gammaproteobacteria bacterium]